MIKKHEEWIDNLKGLGIILIVFGHCGYPHGSLLIKYVFTFHVPLFFFISGFLFSSSKEVKINEYVRSRFNRLIVPFFWFNVMAYIGLGLTSKSYHYFTFSGLENLIRTMIFGNFTGKFETTVFDVGTWFLPCLFFTGLYYFLMDKFINSKFLKILIIITLSIIVFIESKFTSFRLPWGMEIAFMGLFCYGLGNLFKSEIKNFAVLINFKYLLLIPILIAINILLLNKTNMSTNNYGNYFNFIFCSASGIFTLIILSKVIGKSFLAFFGANSIIILGMGWVQGLCYSMLVALSFHLLPKEQGYLTGTVQFLGFLVLMIPVIKIINKYLPFLIGRKKQPIKPDGTKIEKPV